MNSYIGKAISKTDYLSVFILFMLSGSPVFTWQWQYFLAAVICLVILKRKTLKCGKYARILLLVLWCVFLCQYVVFETSSSFLAFCNLSAKILFAFFVVCHLGIKFRYVYFHVIYKLCLVSLFFYGIYMLTGKAFSLLPLEHYDSVILWNVSKSGSVRNAGFLWEPGAFSGYIICAFLLYIDQLDILIKRYKKEVTYMLIALITTMSTTGFLVLMLMISYYVLVFTKKKSYLWYVIPFVIALFTYMLSQDFMLAKLDHQLAGLNDFDIYGDRIDHGRFSAALLDWHYIYRHPFIGNGFDSQIRYSDHLYLGDHLVGFGNGFTYMIGCVGIVFMLVYLYLFGVEKRTSSKLVRYFPAMIIILLLQGECFLNYPLFYALSFSMIIENKKYENNCSTSYSA